MNDDKLPDGDAPRPPLRTANRGQRRAPPVIEGEAAPAKPPQPEAAGGTPIEPPAPVDAPAAGPVVEPSAATSEPPPADAPKSDEMVQAAPPPADPVQAPAEAKRGFGSLAAASLVSAGLAAAGVYALQQVNPPASAPLAALEKRLGDVEQKASAVQAPQVSPEALAALDKRVASVEALASGATESARKAAAGALQQAMGGVDGRFAALEKNASGALSNLDARLAAVEKALSAPKTDERATESRAEQGPPVDLEPLRKQIAALEARLQNAERQTAPLAEAARAIDGRMKGLEERIQPLAGRIDETRTQGEAERKRAEALAERSADASRLALAQSLGAAVNSGAPFAAQIDALARLGVSADALAPLREPAKTGVATAADLARAFAALEPKIVTRNEAPSDSSVIDRLTSSALGLVRIRPTGEPRGDSPADLFARILRALQRGDVAGALKDWERLPEPARSASADWAQRARARTGAEQAARAILTEATQKLGRS